jgi:hypothetical protein
MPKKSKTVQLSPGRLSRFDFLLLLLSVAAVVWQPRPAWARIGVYNAVCGFSHCDLPMVDVQLAPLFQILSGSSVFKVWERPVGQPPAACHATLAGCGKTSIPH